VFHQLVNHNDDLRRLVEKGYAVAIDSGYLVIRDIPYLDAQKQLQWAAIVAKLEFVDQLTVKQDDHQIWFSGSVPHGLDGNPIPNLGGGPTTLPLGEASQDVVVQRRFSNKPPIPGNLLISSQKSTATLGLSRDRRSPFTAPTLTRSAQLKKCLTRYSSSTTRSQAGRK